jgi:predicted nucleic acid-binding protein
MVGLYGRTYFDANILIYEIEASPPMVAAVGQILVQLEAEKQIPITSEFTLAECLVGIREPDLEMVYVDYFADVSSIEVHPVSRSLLISAAHIARANRVKLADAIHIATAIATGCRSFATNDDRLKLPATLRRIRPAPLATPPAGN